MSKLDFPEPTMNFSSEKDALRWMVENVNDDCVDNQRFAYVDDEAAVAAYEDQRDSGCCGAFDTTVYIMGRKALIGCNYGH